jgi:hypothetical protein
MENTENKTLKENDPLGKSLITSVLVAIENIAFEEPEVLPEPVKITGEVVSFSLQVVSPYLLQTRIIIPKELAIRLTKTIYRDDEKEITDSLLDDTVGEFLNTIIGTMMGDLTLGERIFEMGLPEKVNENQEGPAGYTRKYFFRIEELSFCVEIYGDAFIEPQ